MSLNLSSYEPIDSSGVVLPPVALPHPWRRFFARRVDYAIFGLSVGMLLGLTGNQPETESRLLDLMFEVALVVGWIPLEAAFVTFRGGTPGKLLFGIEVRTSEGKRLGYLPALYRSASVAALGMGLGIGLLTLAGCWQGWKSLTESGNTLWDEGGGHVVVHRGVPWWPLAATLLVLAIVAGLMYLNGIVLWPLLENLRPQTPGTSSEG